MVIDIFTKKPLKRGRGRPKKPDPMAEKLMKIAFESQQNKIVQMFLVTETKDRVYNTYLDWCSDEKISMPGLLGMVNTLRNKMEENIRAVYEPEPF